MGKYSVPEEIRKAKPKGTMVKNISGYYYVYEFKSYTDENGKRRTKMGNLLGSIKEGIGFVPNKKEIYEEEVSSLNFGEYAITLANSQGVLKRLKKFFNVEDAVKIYTVALIHVINGYTYMKDIHYYYDESVLSKKYPTLKMGYTALSKLYDALGRRQGNVFKFENDLLTICSKEIAIDGHVIGCKSTENDLAEKGYKFRKIGETQENLLMAYDINTDIPLLSRIYEGSCVDKVSVKDLLDIEEIKDVLFIVDRGFYSKENIELFSSNSNQYIIPLSKNLTQCKEAVKNLNFKDRFVYHRGHKTSVVEYKDEMIDGKRVLTFRDMSEYALEQENYLKNIGTGRYTLENFELVKDLMAVCVLQTNVKEKSAQEIYERYKKRWKIETYYNYFKNKAGYTALETQDYYKTQGLAFIMHIASLIYHDLFNATKSIGKSVNECLLEARMVKAHIRKDRWKVCNCLKRQVDLFEKLNTKLEI